MALDINTGYSSAFKTFVDLTKDIPEVTNVSFAQHFTEKVDL